MSKVLKVPYYFFKSVDFLKSDRKVMLLSTIPVLIGLICYYFLGAYVFGDLKQLGTEYLSQYVDMSGWMGSLFTWIIAIVFAIVINFTFFVFVSVIASPFNDLISERIAELYGVDPEGSNEVMIKKLPRVLVNEFKKVLIIISISILNIAISFIFPPLSFVIAGLLLAVSFVDYSWSRKEMKVQACKEDFKRGVFVYTIGGMGFLFLISIPVLNLFFLPLAVVFFTTLHLEMDKVDA